MKFDNFDTDQSTHHFSDKDLSKFAPKPKLRAKTSLEFFLNHPVIFKMDLENDLCPTIAPFFGYMGIALAMVFSNVGAGKS